ncbi:MAG: hypothetical protein J6K87_02765, partial [Clostridia bacterium]|nr:hypothetical protein [Clostridia bacterium]
MKLSKKIISVLLSTSYMFTSIVFADGPEETPKTGTTKLEKMFLTNVAQYMPMKDKIKLEQVNKFCADSLKMGYADDFLYVYILLNASVDESGHRKLVSSYDFGIAAKAFKNSIRHCCFKETAEVSTISDEFRSLYRINNHNSYNVDKPHDIIFPRAYNLTFDGAERIVKIYGALEGKNNTEIAIKKFIKTKIFDNGEFTTSVKDIQQLKKNLEDGLLSRLKKLEIDLRQNRTEGKE